MRRSKNIAFVLALALMPVQLACGKSDLSKLHDSLNKAAKVLNTAARTNRSAYESGMYGSQASPEAIAQRQRGAKVIGGANDKLIIALNLAQNLTEETFEQGKLGLLRALGEVSANLTTGDQTIDLILQSVATLINQVVILIEAFQSKHLPYVLPEIRTWKIVEVKV